MLPKRHIDMKPKPPPDPKKRKRQQATVQNFWKYFSQSCRPSMHQAGFHSLISAHTNNSHFVDFRCFLAQMETCVYLSQHGPLGSLRPSWVPHLSRASARVRELRNCNASKSASDSSWTDRGPLLPVQVAPKSFQSRWPPKQVV